MASAALFDDSSREGGSDMLEFTRYYNALHCRDYLLGRLFSADW